MTKEKYCQSCGMAMGATDEQYGTNADGNKNQDYCSYCYDKGAFTADCTMEQMIEFCVPHMAAPESGFTETQARDMMQKHFPAMKRWR